ncbi:YdeI/OmpD-associated family protein [Aquiflexum lacus]|uniref:YdeI/OmpD-associated family protein n=1 Tax=Aquiflexum lacus TaxID=2483805 RepID=UPI0018930E44|nr:YdeI/OmpD-associated family protein [Aquiflexum lacus]
MFRFPDVVVVKTENFRKVKVSSSQELRAWLEQHHGQKESVWLVAFKKTVPDKYLSTTEVLDELLCFGWIDGIIRKLDDNRTMQMISPRKVEHWAKTYKDRAAKLIEEGKMQEAGFRSIELSKQAGLWDFMDDVDNLVVPEDLQKALKKYEGATEFFNAINDSSKRFVLRYIKLVKTKKTRVSRIGQIAILASRGEKLKGS